MFLPKPRSIRNACRNTLMPLLVLILSGCAGQAVKQSAVFFPPPPNPPRIQYLTGISRSTDIEGEKSTFSLIMTGREDAEEKRAIIKPYGITTHKGKIYVCDIGVGNVVIIDPAAKKFEYLKGNTNLGKLKKPANLAVDGEGFLYVADVARKEIVVYDRAGNYVSAFGKEVDMKPTDVAIDGDLVYVLDLQKKNNEVKIFDRTSGKLKRSIGKIEANKEGLDMPTNFALDAKGFIYTTNSGSGKVIKLDRDGHILMSFGELGDVIGKFARPKGIAVDEDNRIYVVDAGNQNVQVFNEKGRLLIFFGDPGLLRGSLNLPVSISVTRDNLEHYQKLAEPGFTLEAVLFVTNQFGAEKVSVYGLGQMQNTAGTEPQPPPQQAPVEKTAAGMVEAGKK